MLDIQQWSPHMARMGAVEIPRDQYMRELHAALAAPVAFGDELVVPPPA